MAFPDPGLRNMHGKPRGPTPMKGVNVGKNHALPIESISMA
jgi:hypothetical protein